jgi:hypothetical protein
MVDLMSLNSADDTRVQKRQRLNAYALQQRHQYINVRGFEADEKGCRVAGLEYGYSDQSDNLQLSGSRPNNCHGGTAIQRIQEVETSECCYGMVCRNLFYSSISEGFWLIDQLYGLPVVARSAGNVSLDISNHIPVFFELPNQLHFEEVRNSVAFEITDSNTTRILSEFNAVQAVSTHLYCHAKSELPCVGGPKTVGKQKTKMTRWFLNIIVYGSIVLKDTIGNFLSSYRMYLQDPVGCDRTVLYQNPHIISSEIHEPVMTNMFQSPLFDIQVERLNVGPDLLAQLMENETPLEETEAPPSILANLFPCLLFPRFCHMLANVFQGTRNKH